MDRRSTDVQDAAVGAGQDGVALHVTGGALADPAGVADDAVPLAGAAGVVVRTALGEGDLDGVPPLVLQLVADPVLHAARHGSPSCGSPPPAR